MPIVVVMLEMRYGESENGPKSEATYSGNYTSAPGLSLRASGIGIYTYIGHPPKEYFVDAAQRCCPWFSLSRRYNRT